MPLMSTIKLDTQDMTTKTFEGRLRTLLKRRFDRRLTSALHALAAEFDRGPVFVTPKQGNVHFGKLTDAAFADLVGRPPFDDEVERANCPDAGKLGHFLCGWCDNHGVPRSTCGCMRTTFP